MKSFFRELFEYSHQFNQEFATLLINHPQQISSKSTALFSHLISAHHIWNARILGEPTTFEVWEVHPLANYKAIDQLNFDNSTAILENHQLSDIINYKNTKGDSFNNSLRDILFHVINHSTYHRAQIATALKTAGIAPPLSDWIMYKR